MYSIAYTVFTEIVIRFKRTWAKILLIILIASMIATEASLAYYRAWLLTSGEEMISPTMMDAIIFGAGPILASVIALAVAIAETLAGKYSYEDFIEPVVKGLFRLIGGTLMALLVIVAYWLFGFHETCPPPPGELIPKDILAYRKWAKRKYKDLEKLRNKKGRELDEDVLKLENIKVNYKYVGAGVSVPDMKTQLEKLRADYKALISDITLPEKFKEFQNRVKIFKNRLFKVLKKLTFQEKKVENIVKFINNVKDKLKANKDEFKMLKGEIVNKKSSYDDTEIQRIFDDIFPMLESINTTILTQENKIQEIEDFFSTQHVDINTPKNECETLKSDLKNDILIQISILKKHAKLGNKLTGLIGKIRKKNSEISGCIDKLIEH